MNKYSFDKVYNRQGTDSKKWNMLPLQTNMNRLNSMWIADMEFAVPEFIIDAITKRMAHPIFGYFDLGEDFYEPIKLWQEKRYGVKDLKDKYISYQSTVLGGFNAALYTFTEESDAVLCNTPCYVGFINQCANNERKLIQSELIEGTDGQFTFDFSDMEKKIKANNIKCAVLCSPHNPTGRVWTEKELKEYIALCEKYDVKIISDEIWADFIIGENPHIPTHTINDYAKKNTVSCYAPTKTFNTAGLLISYSIIYDEYLRNEYNKISELTHYNCANTLSIPALKSAYTEGDSWVDEMCEYIKGNLLYATEYIEKNLPKLKTKMPQSTYLLWLDFTEYGLSSNVAYDELIEYGLVGDNGVKFDANSHMRLNLACPREKVIQAMVQLTEYLKNK